MSSVQRLDLFTVFQGSPTFCPWIFFLIHGHTLLRDLIPLPCLSSLNPCFLHESSYWQSSPLRLSFGLLSSSNPALFYFGISSSILSHFHTLDWCPHFISLFVFVILEYVHVSELFLLYWSTCMPLNCCTYILLFFILCLRVPPSHFHCYEVSNFWSRLLHWFFTLFLFLQLAQLGLVCFFEFFFFCGFYF